MASLWNLLALFLFLAVSVNGYSKYGRSCKDIGCLNSEVCVMAEDPCSFGRSSDCGSYPTCKKKSASDSDTHNVPVEKPTTPKPIAEIRPNQPPPGYGDDAPNYPPPPPPRGSSYGNSHGGSYGGSNGGYGGSNGGYGGSNGGYGGSNGGYGGSNGGHGGSNGGFPFGNGGSSSSGSNGGFNPFANIFGNAGGSSGSNGGSIPISSILTNILGNFTKNIPSLNPGGFNTRPIMENKNTNPYPSNPYGSNNPYGSSSGYPSYNNPYQTQQTGYVARNYGQNSNSRSAATTRRPVSYGWNFGIVVILAALGRLLVTNRL